MDINYFKPRGRFDFVKDTLDIGNPLTWDKGHFLKRLVKRLFALDESDLKKLFKL